MKPGTLVAARYRIVRLLGRGGMGEVHEVVDVELDRARALKLMYAHATDRQDARARFELEARVAGRVDSPFLVEVLDTGIDPDSDRLYLVMELLAGENLGQRLERLGRRPPDEVVTHLGQLALALARMHTRGIVHRDLKPTNLFLQERDGEPPRLKVLDLGIAKVLAAGGDTTAVSGTPEYMPPEQLRGRGIGPGTDIYALGLIAFTLLVGHAYWSEARTRDPIAFGLLAVQGTSEPASVRASTAGVTLPAAFDDWFARMTAERAERRFTSAIAAVRSLAAALAIDVPPWLPEEVEPVHLPGPNEPSDEAMSLPRSSAMPSTELAPSPSTSPSPAPSTAASMAPRRRRRWWVAGMEAAVVSLVGGAILSPAPVRPPSPLADPRAVLACPILEVDDVAREGWLGAAAASLVCERARVLLGGRSDRTQIPAELLGLPREPTDAVLHDPYAAADARPRSLDAARGQAAFVDGRVGSTATGGFQVDLVLRSADDRDLARHHGEGGALYAAVRAAMQPMIDAGAIPTAAVPDPVVADHTQAFDTATMLDLLDLTVAIVHNAGRLGDECAGFGARHSDTTERMGFARYECAYTLGQPLPVVALTEVATSTGGAATRARVEHMVNGHDDADATTRLERDYARETARWGRSALASALSCLLEKADRPRAAEWALRAVQNDPKNPTGEWCAPWDQLMTLAEYTARASSTVRTWQAWQPWHPYAWKHGASHTPPGATLTYTERAYRLAPFNTTIADAYADELLRAGRPSDVQGIAVRLKDSKYPVHVVGADRLLVRLDAWEARFDIALARALAGMRPHPNDEGWVRTQRLQLAWHAVELALILGREHEVADAVVTALVDPTPPVIDQAYVDTPTWLAAICAYSSRAVSQRCFDRIPALLPALSKPPAAQARAFTDGARRFATDDLIGAANAWRPLLRDANVPVAVMGEAMVTAFAEAGEPDVAARIVAQTTSQSWNGASMVMVRAAQAAAKAGDHAEARRLARIVVAKWSVASASIPILAEMRALAK